MGCGTLRGQWPTLCLVPGWEPQQRGLQTAKRPQEDDIYLLLTHQLQDRLCSLRSAPVLAGEGWFVGSRLG